MRGAALIALLAMSPVFAQVPQQTVPAQPAATAQEGAKVTSRVRFSNRVNLRAAPPTDASPAPRIDVRHWSIPEQQRIGGLEIAGIDTTPGKALIIYNLRGGELTTIINGKRIVRRVGEFWTLRAGERQTLETQNDTAVVETIVIEQ
jgi:hypothetical protein